MVRTIQKPGNCRCTRCQTEFLPHEGGACPQCGRPLCRTHGGTGNAAVRCPQCERAAQAVGRLALPEAA